MKVVAGAMPVVVAAVIGFASAALLVGGRSASVHVTCEACSVPSAQVPVLSASHSPLPPRG